MKKKIKTALISVSDKKNLKLLLNILKKNKIKIISSGGTYKEIKRLKFKCLEVSSFTNSPEILDGRVKTLHPKIFGGLLGTNAKDHKDDLKKEKIVEFDLLVVNLYPFEETVKNTKTKSKIIEMIDIGGHSLIRAAVKNYEKTIPLINPRDYDYFIKNGVDKSQMSYEGLAHKFPLGGSADKDRRVEILIVSD